MTYPPAADIASSITQVWNDISDNDKRFVVAAILRATKKQITREIKVLKGPIRKDERKPAVHHEE
jgi:hypothetical protein